MPRRRTVMSVLISMALASCSGPSGDESTAPSHGTHVQGEVHASKEADNANSEAAPAQSGIEGMAEVEVSSGRQQMIGVRTELIAVRTPGAAHSYGRSRVGRGACRAHGADEDRGLGGAAPGFVDLVVNKKAEVVRAYFPPDANCLLSVMDHCLRSRHYVNLVIGGKHPAPQWLTMDAAVKHCTAGIGVWQWASNDEGALPDVIMVCCGIEHKRYIDKNGQDQPEVRNWKWGTRT